MAPKMFNYLFAVASLILLLAAAQSPSVEARKFIGVNQWCRTAYHRRICTSMVHGASTWDEAAMNALKSTLELAKRLQGVTQAIKPAIADLTQTKQDSIMATCKYDLESSIDDLEKSIAALQVKDIGTVTARLSASLHSDCEEAMAEYRVQSPISRYVRVFSKQVDNCLAVVLQT